MTGINDWIIPDWPAPANVKSFFTTRNGGVSSGASRVYASLNLGLHVNDDPLDVARNRAILGNYIPSEPIWLKQVHGTAPVCAEHAVQAVPEGDAVFSRRKNTVCAVMVADCLPIYLCDTAGTAVAVVHAGWRGLLAGVIEQTVIAMRVDHGSLIAWLGPAIGPECFEVGADVYQAFVSHNRQAELAFVQKSMRPEKKWLADMFKLARQRLAGSGITQVYGGGVCTYSDPERFYSYRRDGETGRMAALIWLE